jgi:hypothetical protein
MLVHNREVAVDSLQVVFKNTLRSTALFSNVLWSACALFALSLALALSGMVVLVMMCLFMLADPSEKWDGDTVGQLLLLRERDAQRYSTKTLNTPFE